MKFLTLSSMFLLGSRRHFTNFGLSRYSTSRVRTLSASYDLNSVVGIVTTPHPKNNVPSSIVQKIGKNLHHNKAHPLGIIKKRIEDYCNDYAVKNNQVPFQVFDSLPPIVDTKKCFDDLRVGPDHVSRSPSDTYYINDQQLLRTHTSAHQTDFLSQNVPAFLCSGDVYRRDEVDSSHYPVFHQMEGVRIFPQSSFAPGLTIEEKKKIIAEDLKGILTGLARHLFGNVEMNWREDYFPFTEPSYELEVNFNGKWLEVLGCGVIHDEVIQNALKYQSQMTNLKGEAPELGWAFGLGLERLAMVLFEIPDIRLFWSEDDRFISQFQEGKITKFRPYSKFPLCYKDVSFWLPENGLHSNDVYEVFRNEAGDLVESVELFDQFVHPKTKRTSHAYRICYRSMDRSLENAEINEIQDRVRLVLSQKFGVTLR